ncbi:thioredoxin-like protein [Abortiporus biennis]|nr:thioredoxin-like protein [Abortiporus biennis]
MSGRNTPRPASPYRRRRIIWTLILATLGLTFYFNFISTTSFREVVINRLGLTPSSSRVSKVAEAKIKDDTERRQRVQEIHGLLHFVTAHPGRRLDETEGSINAVGVGLVKVDPTDLVDLRVFSPDGDDNWAHHLGALKAEHPLIVFSKSYCPYSRRAKDLLATYKLDPPPTIIELNERSDGPIIQSILRRLTNRGTVPNVILHGTSIGGSDDIMQLHEQKKLKSVLQEGGLKVSVV